VSPVKGRQRCAEEPATLRSPPGEPVSVTFEKGRNLSAYPALPCSHLNLPAGTWLSLQRGQVQALERPRLGNRDGHPRHSVVNPRRGGAVGDAQV
jgi:hypothetical protein